MYQARKVTHGTYQVSYVTMIAGKPRFRMVCSQCGEMDAKLIAKLLNADYKERQEVA